MRNKEGEGKEEEEEEEEEEEAGMHGQVAPTGKEKILHPLLLEE